MSLTSVAPANAHHGLRRADPWVGLHELIERSLRGDSLAVALYGSHAQGVAGPGSDIDVLQVTASTPRSYSAGPVNVTAYTPSALGEMARRGSLFVLHLRMDARIIRDPLDVLATTLAAYRSPRSYGALYEELRAAAAALHEAADSARYLTGLSRLGVYLLRTAMYARLAERGVPAFALSRATERLGGAVLADALAIRHEHAPTARDLRTLREAIERLVGEIPSNEGGSVEALAVRLAGERPFAADLLAHVLSSPQGSLDYTALTPPFLL